MKKLYTLLTALAVSLSAFAQSSMNDFMGDWTFTFLDNLDGGNKVNMVLTLENNSTVGETVFIMPDGKGLIYVFSDSYDPSTNTINFRFQPWGYDYMTVGGYKGTSDLFAQYNGDISTTRNAYVTYSVEEKKITSLEFQYGSLGNKTPDYIGFKGTEDSVEPDEDTKVKPDSFNYTLVSMQYGVAEPENSLSVSVPSYFTYASTLNEATLFAMADVTAEGFEEYDVYYNLYFDNDPVVTDTKITPDQGDYLIYVEDLEFQRTYTLNVWATSGDYESDKTTVYVNVVSAPDIRVTTSNGQISASSAEVTVNVVCWDLSEYSGDVHFTITAESENGPEVEPLEFDAENGRGSATLSFTGLTGNTEYTYSLSYSAYDQIGGSFDKTNAAQVKFTTIAPTIELGNISYTPISKGATFSVGSVTGDGLGDSAVDVYFSLQDSSDAPQKATLTGSAYVYSFTGLEPTTEYTAVIFGGIGEYGTEGFVKGTEYTEAFTTGEADPYIEITFPEGSYSTSVQSDYYAQITATPTIVAENVTDYTVYYNLYMGQTLTKSEQEVEPTDGEYVLNITELNFSRLYKVEVYATAGGYTSEIASFEITTAAEPSLTLTAEAQNVTETSAQIVVTYEAVNLSGDLTYTVSITPNTEGAPAVDPVTTTETSVTFNIEGLTPGSNYTYNASAQTVVNGRTYMKNWPCSFTTLEASRQITLSDISYTQTPGGATFVVKTVELVGFDEDTDVDVYFALQGSDAAPAAGVLVKNGDEEYYEYTFTGLDSLKPYTAVIFGGVGEYGSDDFFKGTEVKENFVSGELGLESLNVDSNVRVRYFNLQGVEVANPAPGFYIEVRGNDVRKVSVK